MKALAPSHIRLKQKDRLYQLGIPIIGLTGGIATGKSTVSQKLIGQGVPLIDADHLVKKIYGQVDTKQFIRTQHPEAWNGEEIIFPILREKFFKDPAAKTEIEQFIYSRLPEMFKSALKELGDPSYVVYDIPLLFEKGLQGKVDLTVLVYAPREAQKKRIITRDQISPEMAETILDHQLNIEDKKARSDYLIDNSGGIPELAGEIEIFLRQVLL